MSIITFVFRKKAEQDLAEYSSGVSGVIRFVLITQENVATYTTALTILRRHATELLAFLRGNKSCIPDHGTFSDEDTDGWEWIVNHAQPHVYRGSPEDGRLLTDVNRGAVVCGYEVCSVGDQIEIPYHTPRALVPVMFNDGHCAIVSWDPSRRVPCTMSFGVPQIDAIIGASVRLPSLKIKQRSYLEVVCIVATCVVSFEVPWDMVVRTFDPPHGRT